MEYADYVAGIYRTHLPYAQCLQSIDCFYVQRQDPVVKRLKKAIRMIQKPTGEILKNKIVRIGEELTMN
jgi:hypothetical protein